MAILQKSEGVTDMHQFVRVVVLSLVAVAAVLGAGSLVSAADSHDAIAVNASVSIADDISWQ
ncbi:hypothetical protein ACFVUY_01695 [Kitasatospora sp. NPDC058063]|uniref:hypothetical protein n=1 Tax=unclassified Kitasatospora TaxID=2633591 RepID=UPI0036D98923